MYGMTVKMSTNSVANPSDLQSLYAGFAGATYVQDLPLMYPDAGSETAPSGYLYDKSGNFVNAFTVRLDAYCPYWQQVMPVFYNISSYTGKVNIDECMGLFPRRVEYPEGVNAVYLTADDMNIVFCVNKVNGNIGATWFYKDNGGYISSDVPINIINFDGAYVHYLFTYMVDYKTNRMFKYSSLGYSTLEMEDGFYFYGDSAGSMSFYTLSALTSQLDDDYVPPEAPDPYSPGGSSGAGGGTGTFNRTGDPIPFPSKPAISVTDCGFLTLFATNQAGIKDLADYLWSDLFSAITPGGSMEETITTLKKIVSNPYDAILGCSIVPVTPPTAGRRDVKLYGVLDSGVQLPVVTDQWVMKDCGTLDIDEYWGSYLDYAPYTKVTSLYLPYVGVVSIDTDLIMNKTLQVKYWIDVLSGQCMAGILINGVLEFQYQGHCSTPIPVTSIDFSSTIQSGLSLVGSVANIVGTAAGALGMSAGAGLAAVGGAALTKLPSVASDVMNSKPDIKSGSGIGGSGGLMSCQTPFLILEWPRQSLPAVRDSSHNLVTQKHWTGYPSNVGARLGSVSGYVEVTRVNVNKMSATETEKQEIEQLLMEGVYIE